MGRQAELEAIVAAFRKVHPKAEPHHDWNMDGWRIRVQDRPADWKGTADPEHLVLLPTERKAGLTVHLWDPRHWELMKDHKQQLEAAGFKVMVACVQWNRKAPVDVDALVPLFEATKQ